MSKICFITAIYGNMEDSCKPFCKQSLPTDFICFTDRKDILSNSWQIDTFPYHIKFRSPLDTGEYTNSFENNLHTFNIAKFYKQAFTNIPRLKEYDIVVWIDGTIEIINPFTSQILCQEMMENEKKIIGWHHNWRFGSLAAEATDSYRNKKYSSTFWQNQSQPFQDVLFQYYTYLKDGYDENLFRQFQHPFPHLGVWITCFIAFHNKNEMVKKFLDSWYLQTLKYTTQDQISFSYVVQKTKLLPFTLPVQLEHGIDACKKTFLYIKHPHSYPF